LVFVSQISQHQRILKRRSNRAVPGQITDGGKTRSEENARKQRQNQQEKKESETLVSNIIVSIRAHNPGDKKSAENGQPRPGETAMAPIPDCSDGPV
jgi:hypothetical protein